MNKNNQVAEFERSKDQLDGTFIIIFLEKEKPPEIINDWGRCLKNSISADSLERLEDYIESKDFIAGSGTLQHY